MNDNKAFIDMPPHEARSAATPSHPNIVQTVRRRTGRGHLLHRDGAHPRGGSPGAFVRVDEEAGAHRVSSSTSPGIAARHVRRPRLRPRKTRPRRRAARHRPPRRLPRRHRGWSFTGDVKIVDFGIAKSEGHFRAKTRPRSSSRARPTTCRPSRRQGAVGRLRAPTSSRPRRDALRADDGPPPLFKATRARPTRSS